MNGMFTKIEIGDVSIVAEVNKGHPPEFWAEQATKKILGTSYQHLGERGKEQAEAFREKLKQTIYNAIIGAIRSNKQTMAGELRSQGSEVLAAQILNMRIR